MGANSRGLESPIVPAAKGMGKQQRCVYIDEAAMANLCFGLIGSGEHFCLAKKLGSYTHCGIPAHAKGIRKKNKAMWSRTLTTSQAERSTNGGRPKLTP